MLALSRKEGDSIIIGDNIEIFIISISGEKVKIGINAPKDISIYRKEIYEQVMKENKSSVLEIDIKDIKDLFKK